MTIEMDTPTRRYRYPSRVRVHALVLTGLTITGLILAAVIGLGLWIEWSRSAMDRRVRGVEPAVTHRANDVIDHSPVGCRSATNLPGALAGLGHWQQVCVWTSPQGGRQLALEAKVDAEGAVSGLIYANGTPESPDTCLHHLHGGWWQDTSNITCPTGWTEQGGP